MYSANKQQVKYIGIVCLLFAYLALSNIDPWLNGAGIHFTHCNSNKAFKHHLTDNKNGYLSTEKV
jgi:hypothetical protein